MDNKKYNKYKEAQLATPTYEPVAIPTYASIFTSYKPTPTSVYVKKKWAPTPNVKVSILDKVYKDSNGKCAIKGNIGVNGRIYHLPNCRLYDRTIAERYFCTIREAQAAGFTGCDLE